MSCWLAERKRIERSLSQRAHEDREIRRTRTISGIREPTFYQDEFDEGLAEDLREDLPALERAEARLAAGTIGHLVESGQPIPDERLEALPTAERTIEEEEAH